MTTPIPNASMPSTSKEEARLAGRAFRFNAPTADTADAAKTVAKKEIPPFNAETS